MNLKDHLQTIIALAAVVGIVLGALAYFATAEDLRMVELRLDQKIVTDQMIDAKRQMWQLEDRNKDKGRDCLQWPDRDRDEYRKLQEQVEQLRDRSKGIRK